MTKFENWAFLCQNKWKTLIFLLKNKSYIETMLEHNKAIFSTVKCQKSRFPIKKKFTNKIDRKKSQLKNAKRFLTKNSCKKA